MSAAIPIYAKNDMYVPTFEVKVRQQDVPAEVLRDIISVTYRDSLEEFSSVDIMLNNWDDSRSALPTHSPISSTIAAPQADLFSFDRNKMIEVSLGYEGVERGRRCSTARVESIEPHCPAGGAPSLTVRVINPLKSLQDRRRRNRTSTSRRPISRGRSRVIITLKSWLKRARTTTISLSPTSCRTNSLISSFFFSVHAASVTTFGSRAVKRSTSGRPRRGQTRSTSLASTAR